VSVGRARNGKLNANGNTWATTPRRKARHNIEAERVGRPITVIPLADAAGAGVVGAGGGAGPKRAAPPKPAAPATGKKTERAAPMIPSAPEPSKKMKKAAYRFTSDTVP